MQKILITILFLWIAPGQALKAQNYTIQFRDLLQKNDTIAEKLLLKKWSAAQPGNAELYAAYFNYYFQKGRFSVLSMSAAQPAGKSIALSKKGSKEIAGYIGDVGYGYNQYYLDKAFSVIDTAIGKYPDRLDMRFGKIHVLGVLEQYTLFTDEVIKTVNYSVENNNRWTWTNNTPKAGGEAFMLGGVQDYTVQLYNAGGSQLDNMARLCEAVLKNILNV